MSWPLKNNGSTPTLRFQGRFDEAKAIYLRFKGKAYEDIHSWEEIFLQDLDELQQEGVTYLDVKKVRKFLTK